MLKKELAAALGISPAMVSKLAKRGMPTDTLERAQRWRRRHLEPGRVKGVRYEDPKPLPTDPVARANAIGAAAVAAFETHERELREALRAVPAERRQEVVLDFDVWERLYGTEFLDLMAARDTQYGDVLLTEGERRQVAAGASRDEVWREADALLTEDELKRYNEIMWGLATGTCRVAPDPYR